MKYLWTEDTGAGLHFWKLVNQLFFDNERSNIVGRTKNNWRRKYYEENGDNDE